ncbi:hypothetical protein Q1695_015878 [Nippostrongylus brasiliensis]|nr:hypothetical protein Q1695_015878 [Nippostrongylus brasiliensis]
MIATKALLLLLFAADTQQKNPECRPLPYNEDEREYMKDMFQKKHEGLNLTFDCEAMYQASLAAGPVMVGNPTHVDHYWCQYSRTFFDPFGLVGLFTESAVLRMPWNKIKQTAKLHPRTIYGCAYRRTPYGVFGPYMATVCIYQRKAPETRCFCN